MRSWLGLGVGVTVIEEIKQLYQLAGALLFHITGVDAQGGDIEKSIR
tara:strand:+ start:365 stop:505 length:141 start_codon:yes stop_codon:yes gene_type:complete